MLEQAALLERGHLHLRAVCSAVLLDTALVAPTQSNAPFLVRGNRGQLAFKMSALVRTVTL
jgi:hypothetical protein